MTEMSGGCGEEIRRLVEIMARLRDKESGCPWDLEQDFGTIAPYTIEEAYEVADAISRGDFGDLREELGDLLFQVVFHSRMAEEAGEFQFSDVAKSISDKMIRRHPHVFGEVGAANVSLVEGMWEATKERERAAKFGSGQGAPPPSVLDGIAGGLPALIHAEKLQKRAARVGFDWNDMRAVREKLLEEADELVEATESGNRSSVEEEMGDLLFVAVNLSRHLNVDPEQALRRANEKFIRRFRYIETALASDGRDIRASSLEEMEELWQEAKRLAPAK